MFTYGIRGERMTGIARYAVELTRAIARIDPTCEIILLNPNPEDPHPWYAEFPNHPLPHLRLLPFAATIGNLELHKAAEDRRLDVLFDPTGIAPFLAPRGAYLRAVTVHDAIPFIYPDTQPLLTRVVFNTLVRFSSRSADLIITVSESASRDLQTYVGLPASKIRVTPLGATSPPEVDVRVVDQVLRDKGIQRPFLLYVGALHPRKNLARVLEAFHGVRGQRPAKLTLAIVGPSSWGAHETLQTVKRPNATNPNEEVVYTGFVSDGELDALYAGATALVFPSLYEGFGLPILEAMRRGTPVLTSDRSAMPEVAGGAALLVSPFDVQAIRGAMRRLLDDGALRQALARQGRRRADAFTWERSARATLDAFDRALRR